MLTQQHWYEICPTCKTEFRYAIVAPPAERTKYVVTFQRAYIAHYDLCKKTANVAHKNRIARYLNDNTNR